MSLFRLPSKMDENIHDKYPFGVYDKVFMKVQNIKVNDLHNWRRVVPPKLCFKHTQMMEEENHRKERQRRMAPKPMVSTEALVGHRNEKGHLISLNEELIALFRVEGNVYAMRDSCPHAGAPLSMGDIEELPGRGICVRCPWHYWRLSLASGEVLDPWHRDEVGLTYPVNVTSEGDIYIGFDGLSRKFFNLSLHPSPKKSKTLDTKDSLEKKFQQTVQPQFCGDNGFREWLLSCEW